MEMEKKLRNAAARTSKDLPVPLLRRFCRDPYWPNLKGGGAANYQPLTEPRVPANETPPELGGQLGTQRKSEHPWST